MLSDEQIRDLWNEHGVQSWPHVLEFARAIEAAARRAQRERDAQIAYHFWKELEDSATASECATAIRGGLLIPPQSENGETET